MIRYLFIAAAILVCGSALAQPVPSGPISVSSPTPCTAFGTTAATCAAGNATSAGVHLQGQRTTTQTLTGGSGTWVAVAFNSAVIDTTGGLNTTTGIYSVSVPGIYHVCAQTYFSGTFSAAQNGFMALMKNGAPGSGTYISVGAVDTIVGEATSSIIACGNVNAVATDTLAAYVNITTSAGDPSVAGSATPYTVLVIDRTGN